MAFERNPNIPLPPPPPGGPKKPTSQTTPSLPSVERQQSPELSEMEQVLFKNSAEYSNLTEAEAQMTPKLREILNNFRQGRLFAIQCYTLSGGGDGHECATYDTKALHMGAMNTYDDIDPLAQMNRPSIEYKMSEHVAEAVAFTPVETRDKIREGEYGPARPKRFQEVYSASSKQVAQEQVVRLTYHVSDPRDRARYSQNTRANVAWRKTRDAYDPRNRMYVPEPISANSAENIQAHMQDILRVPDTHGQGRPGNQLAISLMLPEPRARELWAYFQKNPQQVRPFFVAGAEDLMSLHLPPPYKEWDQELPQRPVLFREFGAGKKEVAKTIRNSK